MNIIMMSVMDYEYSHHTLGGVCIVTLNTEECYEYMYIYREKKAIIILLQH